MMENYLIIIDARQSPPVVDVRQVDSDNLSALIVHLNSASGPSDARRVRVLSDLFLRSAPGLRGQIVRIIKADEILIIESEQVIDGITWAKTKGGYFASAVGQNLKVIRV